MADRDIFWGDTAVRRTDEAVTGSYVDRRGEQEFVIRGVDRMDPFLLTLASPYDHWLFVSSRGGITCGRKNADHALFPYYTDDKIHDAASTTGPYTAILVAREGRRYLWRPFCREVPSPYAVRRRIGKDPAGGRITFTEHNDTLRLSFCYSWEMSDRFGFVRTSRLRNHGAERSLTVLDGIRNVLPAGVDRLAQERVSTLLDGYKQCELDTATGMGIYTLGSILTDRAEPSEALRATTVFRVGLPEATVLLSEQQVEATEAGCTPRQEGYVRGRRGAYLLVASMTLAADREECWSILSDVEQDAADAVELRERIARGALTSEAIREDLDKGREELRLLVASADGIQLSGDRRTADRHFSNVLFNIMRGGVYLDGYRIDTADFSRFLRDRNRRVYERCRSFRTDLPPVIHIDELRSRAVTTGDADLRRLVLEYLPLVFSRRHGDPSRPWNRFSIDLRDAQGRPRIAYQGNWRDIFQNWEALSLSFPRFLNSIVARFLNASTPDGYNPYRISESGFDWEILDPTDPWSNIGYWGDHQIVYLHRLLALSFQHDPDQVRALITARIYSFADVPYRIARFEEILADPFTTVTYDDEGAVASAQRAEQLGSDGMLVHRDGEPCRATMLEKLLIATLTKLSNFVPDGGIWMNTQRPEWNDANNALAGWGLSIVTTAYLRRFIAFLLDLISNETDSRGDTTEIDDTVERFLEDLESLFARLEARSPDDTARRALLSEAGRAGERYREAVYAGRFGAERRAVPYDRVVSFFRTVLVALDDTIRRNRREDGLYHSYNVLTVCDESASIDHLDEMLEGQVAVLASGILDARESLALLQALRSSRLYREDQNSYTLYPDHVLPSFLEKNVISPKLLRDNAALRAVAEIPGQTVVYADVQGTWHFDGDLRNAEVLGRRLSELPLDEDEREEILRVYEEVFRHRLFTGRSGSFFKYEGLGSIYWHMVSKLRLVTAELVAAEIRREDNDREVLHELEECLRDIRAGIGVHKSPAEYGAFPTDPYSHTPEFTGVQQPGMTGQVKEDIISRFVELGVSVVDGRITFYPISLPESEWMRDPGVLRYRDGEGASRTMEVQTGHIAFTYCGVPIIYRRGLEAAGTIHTVREAVPFDPRGGISRALSDEVFSRSGTVTRIDVTIDPD